MKPLLALFLLLLAANANAQIAMRFRAEKPRYLRYEPVRVVLQVSNLSGNTLKFGGELPTEKGSIRFKVDTASGHHVRQFGASVNPAGLLQLAPGQTRELTIVLNQLYDLQREDTYNISAILDHARLPNSFLSKPIQIEVQDGLPVLVRNIGLPTSNPNDVIKSIKLSLLRFTDTNGDIYCIRAEDARTVYSTFRLGDFIDGETPQLEMDDTSLVHLLLQIRPKLYVYYIFGFQNRALKLRQKNFYISDGNGPPALDRSTGYLRVIHAQPAREGIDFIEKGDEKP